MVGRPNGGFMKNGNSLDAIPSQIPSINLCAWHIIVRMAYYQNAGNVGYATHTIFVFSPARPAGFLSSMKD